MKKIIVISIFLAAALSAFSFSDNPLLPELDYSEKPYYIADDELIAEIGGLPLYFDEFRWHAYMTLAELGLEPETADWDHTDGLGETVVRGALKKAVRWRVLELAARDAGIEPDAGAVRALAASISGDWVTENVAAGRARAALLYAQLFRDRYGADGEKLPDDDAYMYGVASGAVRIKAIYLSTSEPLMTEAEVRARREQAAIFTAELNAGAAGFDDIMAAYGEGELDFDGFQFVSGGAPRELYDAAQSLPAGASAKVAEVEIENDGIYIIRRLELRPDDKVSGMDGTLRFAASSALFEKSLEKELDIEYAPAYRRLKPKFIWMTRAPAG